MTQSRGLTKLCTLSTCHASREQRGRPTDTGLEGMTEISSAVQKYVLRVRLVVSTSNFAAIVDPMQGVPLGYNTAEQIETQSHTKRKERGRMKSVLRKQKCYGGGCTRFCGEGAVEVRCCNHLPPNDTRTSVSWEMLAPSEHKQRRCLSVHGRQPEGGWTYSPPSIC